MVGWLLDVCMERLIDDGWMVGWMDEWLDGYCMERC